MAMILADIDNYLCNINFWSMWAFRRIANRSIVQSCCLKLNLESCASWQERIFPALQHLSNHLGRNMIRNLRRNIASFFSELARCSPACGIFQTRENQQVFEIMQQFLSAQINIFDSASHADLATLQEYVPILVKFLHATTNGGIKSPSDIVSELVTHILDVCRAPYSEPPPPPASYLPPAESQLSFFYTASSSNWGRKVCCWPCGKTNALIHAENSPWPSFTFPRNICSWHMLRLILRWCKAVSHLGIHSKFFDVFTQHLVL